MDNFQTIYNEALEAASKAIKDRFQTHNEEPFNCGFAWVTIRGGTKFAKWCLENDLASTGYPSGVQFWCPGNWPTQQEMGFPIYQQDRDFLVTGARAFAQVLRDAGIVTKVQSRLD